MSLTIPPRFDEYLQKILGDKKSEFLSGSDYPKRNAIRINTLKADKTYLRSQLERSGFRFTEIPSLPETLLVDEEPTLISKTLEHFLGLFYIQSVASMIPPVVLNPQDNELILDLSAAPGSKTTQIAQIMNNRGAIIANDKDGQRIKTLSHNLDRMGVLNAAMVNMAGERIGNILPETFDKALVDAPCSALGVLHKAPSAVDNLNYLAKFAFIQEQLLVSAVKALKTGGSIVYSTCTVSIEENEKVLDAILKRYPSIRMERVELPKDIHTMAGLSHCGEETWDPSVTNACRILPSKINPEGFFVAKLTKTEPIVIKEKEPFFNSKIEFKLKSSDDREIQAMAAYFGDRFGIANDFWDDFSFLTKEDEILIASKYWLGRESILNKIYTHRVGTRLARTRREGEWKLSTNAAQLFGKAITNNIIDLEDRKEIETFVAAGTIRRSFSIATGGVIVRAGGSILGCGVMHQGNLKSQMPKSRTVIGVDIV